jgi:hypothetical protein
MIKKKKCGNCFFYSNVTQRCRLHRVEKKPQAVCEQWRINYPNKTLTALRNKFAKEFDTSNWLIFADWLEDKKGMTIEAEIIRTYDMR